MIKNLGSFLSVFLVALLVTYAIHIGVVRFFELQNNPSIASLSYIFNVVYTIVLMASILIFNKKFKDQIGFIFMAGSFIKLGVFVTITKLYGIQMSKSVFLDFFIPYVVSLIIEVYYVSKILNSSK